MNYLLGVLGKRFSDLRTDEFITLLAILLCCLILILWAISVFMSQLQKFDSPGGQSNLPKRLKTVSGLRDRHGFTD